MSLGAYYLVGTRVAAVLAFVLHLRAKGLLIGLATGSCVQASCLLSGQFSPIGKSMVLILITFFFNSIFCYAELECLACENSLLQFIVLDLTRELLFLSEFRIISSFHLSNISMHGSQNLL